MPKEYNSLEKLLYTYINMCYMFSYNYNFFVDNDKYGELVQDFNNISNINMNNLYVVCYEFNTILGLVVESLGFSASVYDMMSRDDKPIFVPLDNIDDYKNRHYSLALSNGKYKILFDSTRDGLKTDLMNVKCGRNVNGIFYIDGISYDYFQYELDKVYSEFMKSHGIVKSSEYRPVIDLERDFLDGRSFANNQSSSMVFGDKISSFIDEVDMVNGNLGEVESIGFVSSIYDKKFRDENEVKTSFRLLNDISSDKPVAIICFNEKGINGPFIDDNLYYIYDCKNGLRKVMDNDKLYEMLFNKELIYINNDYDLNVRRKK